MYDYLRMNVQYKKVTFGTYIRNLRLYHGIGLRELARQLGISAPYLSDLEKDKRCAPRVDLVRDIAKILGANVQNIYDLAGKSRGTIATDIEELLVTKPEIVALLRSANFFRLTNQQILEIKGTMASLNTGVIIIAAGLGSRLKKYTEKLPKCMLDFAGKTLLQRQIEAFNKNGLNNISVIRGFEKEKINYPDLTYFENINYKTNNILNSLMYAEDALNEHVIVSYSDILFEKEVVERLLKSEHDISIVVDIDWRGYYINRKDHPINEAENVIFDVNNNVVEIGKILTGKHDVHGEFIGMLKFSPRGSEIFKKHFHRAKDLYWNKPFQRAETFQKAYITDIIQDMSDLGVPIHCVIIERGWKEIDTEEDYKNALKAFNEEL
jgi:L-glutamine-phosphate cytidylyltransferase